MYFFGSCVYCPCPKSERLSKSLERSPLNIRKSENEVVLVFFFVSDLQKYPAEKREKNMYHDTLAPMPALEKMPWRKYY
jgi:hypothetical protein